MSAVAAMRGTDAMPETKTHLPTTSKRAIDDALLDLDKTRTSWLKVTIPERIRLLEQLLRDTVATAEGWVRAGQEAKDTQPDTPAGGEEWLVGPVILARNARLLIDSLKDVWAHGTPRPERVWQNNQLRVVARVLPVNTFEKILFSGFTADVWMQPDVAQEDLPRTMAVAYRDTPKDGKTALVLGAGNVPAIGATDALYKLFVENQVVVLKMNPVNDYIGPHLERAMGALVAADVLRLVYGGTEEGAYLCQHPMVHEIHITGSDKTHDAIVFGTGAEGQKRKTENKPRLQKRVTSELGNVSPVIVVPGPWSTADVAFQATNLVTMLATNAGFNCNSARVLVQHAAWRRRQDLLDAIKRDFTRAAPRKAYYPGAEGRHQAFVHAHPEAWQSPSASGALPWTLISNVPASERGDICFTTEAFCGVVAETTLEASTIPEFVARAVEFCNETLWGTLNATILVHPATMQDPAVAAAVENAVANLRYGTICINHWPAVAFGMCTPPWGAFPGATWTDIQSGVGVVHNTYMFDRSEKSVVRGPFRVFPKPLWFFDHQRVGHLAPKVMLMTAFPSWTRLPGIMADAVRG